MNNAVYKFKRYEDASLSYTGINKYEDEDFGLYDTVITRTAAQKVCMSQAVRGTRCAVGPLGRSEAFLVEDCLKKLALPLRED